MIQFKKKPQKKSGQYFILSLRQMDGGYEDKKEDVSSFCQLSDNSRSGMT